MRRTHAKPKKRSTAEKFWSLLRKDEASGCWEWTRSTDNAGYGQLAFVAVTKNHQPTKAHRVAWALAKNNGELPPPGTHIHHICANPLCCNPDHLQLATAREHVTIHYGDRCPRGHGPEHWRIRGKSQNNARYCRECDKERNRANRAARSVPCASCGKPRLSDKDTGKRRNFTGLCLACYRASLSKSAAA